MVDKKEIDLLIRQKALLQSINQEMATKAASEKAIAQAKKEALRGTEKALEVQNAIAKATNDELRALNQVNAEIEREITSLERSNQIGSDKYTQLKLALEASKEAVEVAEERNEKE